MNEEKSLFCYKFSSQDENEVDEENEFLCPWCKSGYLVVRKSDVDGKSFYGCSNYPYCTYTNDDMKAVYNNIRCPECGDFLVLRKGKYGTFWGCHNYPRCKHTQPNTETEKKKKISADNQKYQR